MPLTAPCGRRFGGKLGFPLTTKHGGTFIAKGLRFQASFSPQVKFKKRRRQKSGAKIFLTHQAISVAYFAVLINICSFLSSALGRSDGLTTNIFTSFTIFCLSFFIGETECAVYWKAFLFSACIGKANSSPICVWWKLSFLMPMAFVQTAFLDPFTCQIYVI